MDVDTRLKLEMGARVHEFLHGHSFDGQGFTVAVAAFDALLDRATAHLALQRDGITTSRAATRRRSELRSHLRERLLRYLAGVARVAARKHPEMKDLFRLPAGNLSHLAFLTAVRRLLTEAESHQELLMRGGLESSVVADIGKALAELEAIDSDGRNAHAGHVGARADLLAVGRDIMDQVNLLEGMIRYRFADDPEVLAQWKSARKVPGRSAHRKGAAPAEEGSAA